MKKFAFFGALLGMIAAVVAQSGGSLGGRGGTIITYPSGTSGSGGSGGNVTNTGAATVGMIHVITDTTGNQVTPTNRLSELDVTTLTLTGLSASQLLATDANTNVVAATSANVTNALGISTTPTELGYVSGVTSAIQGQLDAKAPLASPALTGTPTINGASIETQLTNKVEKAGDTMTGALTNNVRYAITNDVFIERDAANTLAMRNGANAQGFNIYNTYTDASNYERAKLGFVSNTLVLGIESAGTGTARDLQVIAKGTTLYLNTGGVSSQGWKVSGGNLIAATDNTYDIGANGATRPRNVYVGSSVNSPGYVVSASGYIQFDTRTVIRSDSNGTLKFWNATGTDFDRLQLGGTTASFPAIKRNAAGLDVRLADDSNYGVLNAPNQQSGYTKVCTSATSNAVFYVSVPNTNMIGGRVLYTINATDGTDAQQITGTAQFGAVGKATAVTANVTDVQNTSTVSAGTLTAVLTANVSTNNIFALMVNPTTSLTTTNLTVKWRLETPSSYTVNPL